MNFPNSRRWLLVILAIAASLGYGCYYAARQYQARHLRQAFEQALQQRDFAAAHTLMVDYLRICPRDAGVHLLAAQAARRAQFQELFFGPQTDLLHQAASHLDECSRLKSPEDAIALERILLRAQQGELAATEESLLAYLQTPNSDHALVLESLILGCLHELNLDRARGYVDELLALQPDNVQALVWRGRIKEQFFLNLPSAREDYEEALRLNPDFASARYYLVGILLTTNQVEEAASLLTILESSNPGNPLVRLARAQCLIAQGQASAAAALLDDWLKKESASNPRRVEALVAHAGVCLALDQPDDAERYSLQALRISPMDRNALYNFYRSLIDQGRRQEAEKVGILLEQIRKDFEFVAKAPQRIAQSPDDLALRHRIGEAYLRLGRGGEAVGWLQSVLDRDPGYRPTLQALAGYYDQTGDGRRAAEYRQRAAAASQGIKGP